MRKRGGLCGCCHGDSSVADDVEDATMPQEEAELVGGRVAAASSKRQHTSSNNGGVGNFLRLAPDNPWLVCRSADHNGKLFWMHEDTHETTWKQPLPSLKQLPAFQGVDPRMRERCFAVNEANFFGACAPPPRRTERMPFSSLLAGLLLRRARSRCAGRPTRSTRRCGRASAAPPPPRARCSGRPPRSLRSTACTRDASLTPSACVGSCCARSCGTTGSGGATCPTWRAARSTSTSATAPPAASATPSTTSSGTWSTSICSATPSRRPTTSGARTTRRASATATAASTCAGTPPARSSRARPTTTS